MNAADDSLKLLKEGNARFAAGLRSEEAFVSTLRLKELALRGQRPFAIVLTCSDSRAPTETIFDLGIGHLYVLRIAGNVLAPTLMAGVEYAATHFDVPLCVVLGHTKCGAIQAAHEKSCSIACGAEKVMPSPNLEKLVSLILKCDSHHKHNIEDLTLANVRTNVARMQSESPLIHRKVQEGTMKIVGAVYNLDSGQVTFDDRATA